MKVHKVSLEQTGQFSKLFLDYVSQKAELEPFYHYAPSLEGFEKAISDCSSNSYNRKLLAEVIESQYKGTGLTAPHVKTIEQADTYTVCTGHQLCLFTGPLYFIFKIISTINLAEELKRKFPDNNFVPIYWMASEDHDFAEINHINLFGKKLEWKNAEGGAVGNLSTKGLSKVIEELGLALGDSNESKELIEIFKNSYERQPTISAATRYLVDALFGKYGLVILDPNDARLKKEFIGIMEDDILENTAFEKVGKSSVELEKLGYKTQVNPREINVFYLYENQRNRIVEEDGQFKVIDSTIIFSSDELKLELKTHPERFSPNVVTRPLYQQKILPNLAYVGGPGELAYWLQYKQLFAHYKIQFPVLMPRNFAMLIDQNSNKKFKKLGLAFDDIFLPANEAVERFINSISREKYHSKLKRRSLQQMFDSLAKKVALVDGSLVATTGSELQKALKSLNELEKKVIKSFKSKNEVAVAQIDKLRDKLIPGGVLQERHENFASFYLSIGSGLIELLKNNLQAFEADFIILSEE